MKLAFVVAIGLLTSLVSTAAQAETVAVLPVSGTNVHPSHAQVAQELLKDHLVVTGKYTVVLVNGPTPEHEPSSAEAAEAARGVGAELALVAHITHLQSTFRVRVTVFRAGTRDVAFSDALASTGGPDQLDPVIQRLMQAFARGEQAHDNAEIDSVTGKEAEPYIKQTATRTVGVRVGAITPLNRVAGDVGIGGNIGLFWLYDARDFMGEAFVELTPSQGSRDEKLSAFAAGISAYRPFSRKNFTPYAGGGVAYSYSQFGGAGAGGLRLHAAFGVLFGRLSTVQLRGELGYFSNTYREHNQTWYGNQAMTEKTAVSHGPMFNVGIGF